MELDGMSFEKALNNLEQIVSKLESGDLSLADSLEMFEQGIQLAGKCNRILEDAEQRISVIRKNDNGEPVEETFEL